MTRPLHPSPEQILSLQWTYRVEGNQKALFTCFPYALLVYKTVPLPASLSFQCLKHYLLQPLIVNLSDEQIDLLQKQRGRFGTGQLTTYAELVPDLATLWGADTVLVELKPKSMVLCRSKLIPLDVCNTLCKFVLPTYHFRNYLCHNVDEKYMPMQLLGQGRRKQLDVLWKQRSRALRILRGGSEWHGNDEVLDVAARVLELESVLEGVREVQKGDCVDCLGAEILLERVEQEDAVVPGAVAEEWREKVSYQSPEEGRVSHCQQTYEQAIREVQQMPVEVAAGLVGEFLAARAAMDCSVLIAMRRGGYDMEVGLGDRGVGRVGEWRYCVRVVDVGGKPVERIRAKWVPREWEYVRRVRQGDKL